MTTLRDLWMSKRLTSTEVAARAGISTPTLYKANRKEVIAERNIIAICQVLGISKDEYEALDVCPMADRYRQP
jgi:DNA-binding Xre family transcriptional regulator